MGTIGVLREERERAQPFEVDLEIEADLQAAGRSDDLDDTIDYGRLTELAVTVIERETPLLLERTAQRIADEILGVGGVEAVTVTVRKLRPPIPHPLDHSAVRIRREHRHTRAFIALGSNLGDRRGFLRGAIEALAPTRQSPVYETDPVGGPDDQGPYLNMVVEIHTDLAPLDLLNRCRSIEAAAGRDRTVHWGPRTLDVDILLYGEVALETEELTIPHPRMWERRFVMQPLRALAPELVPDDWEYRVDPGAVRQVDDL